MCHFFPPVAIKRAWNDQVKYTPRFFLAFVLQRGISCTASLHALNELFLFFPTENVYQTWREHAKTTDQIHSQTGSCLQHISYEGCQLRIWGFQKYHIPSM